MRQLRSNAPAQQSSADTVDRIAALLSPMTMMPSQISARSEATPSSRYQQIPESDQYHWENRTDSAPPWVNNQAACSGQGESTPKEPHGQLDAHLSWTKNENRTVRRSECHGMGAVGVQWTLIAHT